MAHVDLERRAAILEAVGYASTQLLETNATWEDRIDDVLAALGDAAAVSRVYVFQNFIDGTRDDGTRDVHATQRHEWVAEGAIAQDDNPLLKDLDYSAMGWRRWIEILGGGDPVHGVVAEMPADEQPHLIETETVSIAIVPITIGPEWWGFIGFDDCATPRIWTAELTALRAAASTLAAAIQRERTRAELTEREVLLERRVSALATIASNLTVDQRLGDVLERICRCAADASGAMAAAIHLVGPTGDLEVAACSGLPEGWAEAMRRSWDLGVQAPSTDAMRRQELRLIRNAPQTALAIAAFAPLHPHLREVPWTTMAVVPLDSAGRHIGAMNLYWPDRSDLDSEEIRFLRAVADQGALAVENARLVSEAQAKAGLEERQRLARELHDSVSQALYGIALGSRTARALVGDPAKLVEPLDYILSLSEAALAEMRALIFELRPETLAEGGLGAALERHATALRARHGLDVSVEVADEPPIDLSRKEALYRIAQEALHNVTKHARATRVVISMRIDGSSVRVRITDDGIGFDPGSAFPGHFGLHTMRERAQQHGGRVDVVSAPGAGVTVTATVPVG